MSLTSRIIVGVLSALAIASAASAELVGLRVFQEAPGGPGPAPPGPQRWNYRVYAEFTEPTDMVLSWATGSNGFGFGGIWNITANNTPGSGFTNIPDLLTGDIAPYFSGGATDWDTFMTIGLLYGVHGPGNTDYTNAFPNTPLFIANGTNAWTGPGGAFLFGDVQQGAANYRVDGNDTANRVLLMQLVVNAGEHVHGSIGLTWRSVEGDFILTPNLSFNSLPAPSAAFTFILLGLRGKRMRRHSLEAISCRI